MVDVGTCIYIYTHSIRGAYTEFVDFNPFVDSILEFGAKGTGPEGMSG